MFAWILGRDQNKDDNDDDPEYTANDFWKNVEILYTQDTTKYVKMTPETLFNHVRLWSFNRNLDQSRIEELYQAMINKEYLHTPLTLTESGDKIYLIDGQHRYHAMQKWYETNPANVPPIIVLVHHSLDGDNNINELFKCVNNTFPLAPTELPSDQLMNLTNAIVELWPTCIRDKDTKRPYITKSSVKLALYQLIIDPIDISAFCKAVIQVNELYKEKCNTETLAPTTHKIITNKNFYLGIGKTKTWVKKAHKIYLTNQ